MSKTAEYTLRDYKTNTEIEKNYILRTPVLDKIQEYRRNWLQHIKRMSHNRLLRILQNYRPAGRKNKGKPLNRPNRRTSGQTLC